MPSLNPTIFKQTMSCHYLELFPFSVSTSGDFSIFITSTKNIRAFGSVDKALINDCANMGGLRYAKLELIAAGGQHILLLNANGEVFSCGGSSFGQLGIVRQAVTNTVHSVKFPVKIQFISAGTTHSLFLDEAGSVWCCGSNSTGELGTGNKVSLVLPQKNTNLPKIDYISAGNNKSLFVDAAGCVWCAGYNANGQLGVGHKNHVFTPEKIEDLPSIDIVSAGAGSHCLFLDNTGTVWGCGDGKFGSIGTSDHKDRICPEIIAEVPQIQFISAGYHSLLLDLTQQVWVLGLNNCGQLGLGDTENRFSPEPIENLPLIVSLCAGGYHSLLVDSEGFGWSFGCNDFGQLGLAATVEQAVKPTKIPELYSLKANYNVPVHFQQKSARKL